MRTLVATLALLAALAATGGSAPAATKWAAATHASGSKSKSKRSRPRTAGQRRRAVWSVFRDSLQTARTPRTVRAPVTPSRSPASSELLRIQFGAKR